MRLFPTLFLALVYLGAGLSPVRAETRVALVIGNSDYKLISSLANPTNDAALIAETLRGVGFEVISAKNADRRGMARAIRDFGKRLRRAGRDAVGLFYYAGHGVQAAGTNYLIPLAAPVEDEADLEIEAVSASWVLGQMESAGNALNIVIMDACRNNPFKGAFRAATRGLARMNAPSGSLLAYAAAPGQVAADGRTNNSPYTAALAAAMRQPGLDLEDVFKRVRASVETATREKQTPWEESSLKGDFYFVPKDSAATVTPPKTPPAFDARALELTFWQSIDDGADPADFEDYLARYPDGVFVDLARNRLRRLKSQETAPPTPTRAGGTFDGEWRGQAVLIAGATPCPPLLNFRVEFSGNKITGSADSSGEKFEVNGALVGQDKIEGKFFNALGMATFAARNDNGEWRGSWEADGECDGSFHLAKTR